jgi:hypothetical protein
VDARTYLVRYGLMSQVGRFSALPDHEVRFERGQVVVIKSHRGLELGEVLIANDSLARARAGSIDASARLDDGDSSPHCSPNRPHVVRLADLADLARSERARELRSSRFALCQRVLAEGDWPWEVIEVEPLLDERNVVVHYLGPHDLDVASVRARFRVACGFDIVLEPAGIDLDANAEHNHPHLNGGQHSSDSYECDAGGGCGSRSAPNEDLGAPSDSSCANGSSPALHAGCASCGIGKLLAARGRQKI